MSNEQSTSGYTWQDVKTNMKQIFTWSYYKEGFSGWDKQSYIWLEIGLVVILATGFPHGLETLSILSMIGGAIGFACTLAITANKRINGLLGFISAILISIVAFHSKNYSDIVMQMVYVVSLDLNFMFFGNAWQNRKIKAMNTNGWLLALVTFVVAFFLLFMMDTHLLISPRPWLDAFTAAIGVTGAALTIAKFHSQYWMWTLQGLMSVTLWGVTALQGDANWVLFATYILYLGNDVIGLFFSPWSRATKAADAK
ncbi:nicotinamide riboside transporter PnuC [Fructobacillus tropaeoli]|uniref:Nicotinamide mononucleotide transporter n=1 Tax=Fructobacillus tropaeoli TaxID=709323 RepID=A0A3F3H1N9_9LACO|nr:nicotinamide riboside transporter PnuC [Fructobacillus tropaeoli]GAP03957.1 nicotinamide mononucleotide transporter [Fructobacillus tropaeoli]GIC69547.1 nicotinamide mononucleotide transporter [Fructobacillus tropaeoli]CAK1233874.1 Nicotinamide riboside transporter PnuC (PnuC) [Fructobacillus tropaeoli]